MTQEYKQPPSILSAFWRKISPFATKSNIKELEQRMEGKFDGICEWIDGADTEIEELRDDALTKHDLDPDDVVNTDMIDADDVYRRIENLEGSQISDDELEEIFKRITTLEKQLKNAPLVDEQSCSESLNDRPAGNMIHEQTKDSSDATIEERIKRLEERAKAFEHQINAFDEKVYHLDRAFVSDDPMGDAGTNGGEFDHIGENIAKILQDAGYVIKRNR